MHYLELEAISHQWKIDIGLEIIVFIITIVIVQNMMDNEEISTRGIQGS